MIMYLIFNVHLFIFNKNFIFNQKSESDSFGSILEATKVEIYENLPKCEYHIQGCLIAEDGRHLKLNNNMITVQILDFINKSPDRDDIPQPMISIMGKNNQCKFNVN